jgi:hypothetical protein
MKSRRTPLSVKLYRYEMSLSLYILRLWLATTQLRILKTITATSGERCPGC